MGITIINKSDPAVKVENPKLALVLAGGAISGGAFKVGGLKALNDTFANKKVTEFDIYVGISAGAFLAAPLSGGITPDEMLASLDGKSKNFSQLSPFHLYKPNFQEFFNRPYRYLYGHLSYFPGMLYDLLSASSELKGDFWKNLKVFLKSPSYSNYEQLMTPLLRVMYASRTIPALGELLPSGFFDNSTLEKFVRQNLKKNRMSNNFKVLKKMSGKSLYIVAMNLDTSERVVFGPDEKNDVTISQAIQASSAIPGFYKPARIKGVDYIDGAVRKTANIDVAVEKGADLVICYNPFRPFNNDLLVDYIREENKYVTRSKRISDWGLGMVINQVFRTLFHSRLMSVLKTYREDINFKKDIILIEPKEDDNEFFAMNPLFFWNRTKAATSGFLSVSNSIDNKFETLQPILKKYGVEMTRDVISMDKHRIEKSFEKASPKRHLRFVPGGSPFFSS